MSTDRSDPSLAYTIPYQLTKKIHRNVPEGLLPEKDENSQKGKIIVITGGATGIGEAAASVWVRAAAAGVVIAGRRQKKLDEAVRKMEKLNAGGTKILAVQTDLKVERQVENLFEQVNKTFGRPADVVIANAGWVSDLKPMAEESVSTWWSVYERNVLGLHNTVTAWIRSQPDPGDPTGTLISVKSGLAGSIVPGVSAYSTAKLAAHRYMEYVATGIFSDLFALASRLRKDNSEYSRIRSFTTIPGITRTDMDMNPLFIPYAKDHVDQTGALALYLASSRADYLRGSLVSVNWDLEEMQAHKDEIEQGLLKIKWVPILPTGGTPDSDVVA